MEYEIERELDLYPRFIMIPLLAVAPILGIFLLGVGIYSLVEILRGELQIGACIMGLLFGGLCGTYILAFGIAAMMKIMATYRFTSKGLLISYPLGKTQFETWDAFQEICVCYAAYTTRGKRRANSVICFAKKGEKRAGNGRWKTENLLRYRSIILIDYAPTHLEALRTVCPYDIKDLRDTPAYRL